MRVLLLALIVLAVPSFAKRDDKALNNPFHGMDLDALRFPPQPERPGPQAPPARRSLAEEWAVAKEHFLKIMEADGDKSLAAILGKKAERSAQEEALFQTYNKLKANGKVPKDKERLAKELFYLHTMEIAASYAYLLPKFADEMSARLKKEATKYYAKSVYELMLKNLKESVPNPTKEQLDQIKKAADNHAKQLPDAFKAKLEEKGLESAELYLMNLLRGVTNPLAINPKKVLDDLAKGKDGLVYLRTPEILGVYVKPEHDFLKTNSKILGKLFASPAEIHLSADEKRLPKAQQEALLKQLKLERNANTRFQNQNLLESTLKTYLEDEGLFGPAN